MTKALYFAYGSNMLSKRLKRRCGSACFHSVAIADNHSLDFSKIGKDRSGKATIFKEKGKRVCGVLYELSEQDILLLDGIEGNHYYRENNFHISPLDTNDLLTASTYLAHENKRDQNLKPFDWYKALVIAGAREHKFPEKYIEMLMAVEDVVDPQKDRRTQLEALEILRAVKI